MGDDPWKNVAKKTDVSGASNIPAGSPMTSTGEGENKTVAYEGFLIEPRAMQLANGLWKAVARVSTAPLQAKWTGSMGCPPGRGLLLSVHKAWITPWRLVLGRSSSDGLPETVAP